MESKEMFTVTDVEENNSISEADAEKSVVEGEIAQNHKKKKKKWIIVTVLVIAVIITAVILVVLIDPFTPTEVKLRRNIFDGLNEAKVLVEEGNFDDAKSICLETDVSLDKLEKIAHDDTYVSLAVASKCLWSMINENEVSADIMEFAEFCLGEAKLD